MSNLIMERSYVTDLLVTALLEASVGQIVQYKDLQQLVNHDVQGRHRYLLERARHICMRDHKRAFTTVMNVGLQRTAAEDLVKLGKGQIKRVRNAAKKGAVIMDTVQRTDLTERQALEHDATRGILAAIQTASKPRKSNQTSRANADPQVKL